MVNYALIIGLANYSRSLAAFKAVRNLKILQLPSEKSLKSHMNLFKKKEGIDEEDMNENAKKTAS